MFPKVKTFKFRLKNTNESSLNIMAGAVNFVWNYCNDTSMQYLDKQGKWLSGFDLGYLTAGCSKDLPINAQSIKAIAHEYALRAIEDTKERIRQEEEKKKAAALQAKIDALHAVEASHDLNELMVIPDEVFAELLEGHTIAYNHKKAKEEEERLLKEAEAKKEKERLAAIEKAEEERRQRVAKEQEAERIRLEKVRQDQEAKDKEFERERNRIRQEQEAFEKKKAEFEASQKALVEQQRRTVELEEAKKIAAQEALKRAEYEAKEIAFQARLEKERKEQEMAEKPDKVKLANLGIAIGNLLAVPITLSTKASKERYNAACNQITDAIDQYLTFPKK